MSQQEALFLLCGYPILLAVIFAVLGWFWCAMKVIYRDSDTRRFPRPGTQPQRPERFKPYRRHPDMLTDDDETKTP